MTAEVKVERSELEVTAFPWYGWLGAALALGGWFLNWKLSGLRTQWAFFPMWVGYCLAVDALVR